MRIHYKEKFKDEFRFNKEVMISTGVKGNNDSALIDLSQKTKQFVSH